MDLKTVESLVELMKQKGVAEIEIEDGEKKVRVSMTGSGNPAASYIAPQPVAAVAEAAAPASISAGSSSAVASTAYREVRSPFVGTFYSAPSPDSDPFVAVGTKVRKGMVLCIVEAMKLMNEIEAEIDGTIAKILVNNGDSVEFDQVLFHVE